MFDVRPATNPLLLRRERLLERLPDRPGHVVWLEAPYGYGKSVLAAQWAQTLEDEGWRVVWLSLAGREPKPTIAQALELPANAPWGVIIDELWRCQTLLVLEDLDGSEDLSLVLGQVGGLILLASRQSLPYPGLLRLRTERRLTQLSSDQLAFTKQEAAELFSDTPGGDEAWRLTHGWSLPLHFAALTGDLPQHASLLEGVRRSVSDRAWRELLFLATVEVLPKSAAVAATGDLVRSGFLQNLEGGYRLHPLMAESVLGSHRERAVAELATQAGRLEPAVRAAAFERVGDVDGLAQLLASGEGGLYQSAPEEFLRWETATPSDNGLQRRAHVTIARLVLNQFEPAAADALELVAEEGLPTRLRARLVSNAISRLAAAKRLEVAAAFEKKAYELLNDIEPLEAASMLRNLATLDFVRGDFAQMEARLRAGLGFLANSEAGQATTNVEFRLRANLNLLAWEVRGEIDEPLASQLELLSRPDLDDTANVMLRQNLAVSYALKGEEDKALEQLRIASGSASTYSRLLLRQMTAYFEGDLQAFPGLLTAARRWETFEMSERVSALWLRALRRAGDLVTAFDLLDVLEIGPFTKLELVWAEVNRGGLERARQLVTETRGAYPYREFQLHWHAANYLVERTPEALEALFALTRNGTDALRYTMVPLSTLPQDRPELSVGYPLEQVLAAGWEEAVKLRLAEIPPLEVRLLGEVRVTRMGEDLQLTDRQRELITLLALGATREAIGEEIWPEADVKKQRNNLGVQLNLLRKLLEPWGVTTFLGERSLRHFWTDLQELDGAIAAADAPRVLNMYEEPLAPGVEVGLVADQRYDLRERVVQALLSAALTTGNDDALSYLKRVVELEPLHEEALQALLATLQGMGRRGEALKHFRRFEEQLQLETGLAPHPKTVSLASSG